jgi:hypothetical protein
MVNANRLISKLESGGPTLRPCYARLEYPVPTIGSNALRLPHVHRIGLKSKTGNNVRAVTLLSGGEFKTVRNGQPGLAFWGISYNKM